MTPAVPFTVRSSSDLVAAVPYLLGFHPSDSLVVVAMHDREVLFAGRQDLPPPEMAADSAEHLATLIGLQGADRVTLIGYGPEPAVTPVMRAVDEALTRAGIRLYDALRVADGQFGSYFCRDSDCCPRPCPPPDSAVAVAATVAGQVVLPDRSALSARLAPVTGEERAAMVAATARARERYVAAFAAGGDDGPADAGRRSLREAERAYGAGRILDPDGYAWLGFLLLDPAVRDFAWESTGVDEWRVSLWTDVVRRVEPGCVAPAAALLSFVAWRNGLGALAVMAVDRALADDPEYRLARLMEELLCQGVPPRVVAAWPHIRTRKAVREAAREAAREGPTGGRERSRPDRRSV